MFRKKKVCAEAEHICAIAFPSKKADLTYSNLHKHDAGFWTQIDGTLHNEGGADAFNVKLECYAVVNGYKYYATAYVGDIPAGAKDFWCLVDVDFEDVTGIGCGTVTWDTSDW